MNDRYINRQSRSVDSNNNSNSDNNGETRMKSHNNRNRSIWYINANNLFVYAIIQKLSYMDFNYSDTFLDEGETTLQRILITPDDSDHGYYIVCDINYTNTCKDRTEQLALMPIKE